MTEETCAEALIGVFGSESGWRASSLISTPETPTLEVSAPAWRIRLLDCRSVCAFGDVTADLEDQAGVEVQGESGRQRCFWFCRGPAEHSHCYCLPRFRPGAGPRFFVGSAVAKASVAAAPTPPCGAVERTHCHQPLRPNRSPACFWALTELARLEARVSRGRLHAGNLLIADLDLTGELAAGDAPPVMSAPLGKRSVAKLVTASICVVS